MLDKGVYTIPDQNRTPTTHRDMLDKGVDIIPDQNRTPTTHRDMLDRGWIIFLTRTEEQPAHTKDMNESGGLSFSLSLSPPIV